MLSRIASYFSSTLCFYFNRVVSVVDHIHSIVVALRLSTFTGNSRASVTFDVEAGNCPFLVHSYLSFEQHLSISSSILPWPRHRFNLSPASTLLIYSPVLFRTTNVVLAKRPNKPHMYELRRLHLGARLIRINTFF